MFTHRSSSICNCNCNLIHLHWMIFNSHQKNASAANPWWMLSSTTGFLLILVQNKPIFFKFGEKKTFFFCSWTNLETRTNSLNFKSCKFDASNWISIKIDNLGLFVCVSGWTHDNFYLCNDLKNSNQMPKVIRWAMHTMKMNHHYIRRFGWSVQPFVCL